MIVWLVLVGIIAYFIVRQSAAGTTRAHVGVLWLVMMFPALVWVAWSLVWGPTVMMPLWLALPPFLLSPLAYIWLVQRGRLAKPTVPPTPGGTIVVNPDPTSPLEAELLARVTKQTAPPLLDHSEEAYLRDCFPWTVFYLNTVEQRPQVALCFGNLRAAPDVAYRTVLRNVRQRFSDRFLVMFQEGQNGKPFFALVPNPAAARLRFQRAEVAALATAATGLVTSTTGMASPATPPIGSQSLGDREHREDSSAHETTDRPLEAKTPAAQTQLTDQPIPGSVATLPATPAASTTTLNLDRRLVAQAKERRSILISIALVALTLVTTTLMGGIMTLRLAGATSVAALGDRNLLALGWPYGLSIVTILLAREVGRWWAANRRGIVTSWPYLIPLPAFLGTLGAYLQLKSPAPDRKALFDLGFVGAAVGGLVSLPILWWGLHLSTVVPLPDGASLVNVQAIVPESSLALALLAKTALGKTLVAGKAISLHPVAIAGYVGWWLTMFHLLPIGALDGGRILHAMLGVRGGVLAGQVTRIVLLVMALVRPELFLLALLAFFLPAIEQPPLDGVSPLDDRRDFLGLVAMAALAMAIIPAPHGLL